VHLGLADDLLDKHVLEGRDDVVRCIAARVLLSRFSLAAFSVATFGLAAILSGCVVTGATKDGVSDALVVLEELAPHELVALARV